MPMEDILNEFQESEAVPLEIYRHQVGGHSSILCLDERTVCKPLIKQELKFYEMLPNSMKKFTPEYRGVVQVRFEEDQDGYITVAAYPPKSFRYQLSNNKKLSKSRRIRLKNSGSIEIEIESELHELFVDEEGSSSSSANNTRSVRPHNPWVLKCHRDHLSKIKRSGGGSHSQTPKEKEPHAQKFMLLENLTRRFEYPCVLDLKMGTRQYGDDATPAKIESQSAKAASSTSVQLGVRICGMQVYQTTTGKFMCRNKYYGRKLDVEGFREALCQFLHNGNRLRTDALVPLVEKLQELKATLSSLDTFRFYTSSLLLIYEGLDPELNGDDEPQVGTEDGNCEDEYDEDDEKTRYIAEKMEGCEEEGGRDGVSLNVQHAGTSAGTGSSSVGAGSSSGSGSGSASASMRTLRSPPTSSKSAENICRGNSQDGAGFGFGGDVTMGGSGQSGTEITHMNTSNSSEALNNSTSSSSNTNYSNNLSSSARSSRSNLGSRGSTPSAASLSSESVDVRMIDFAHATHSGLDLGHCAKEHAGPDTGYIFGLSNLIKTLQEIIDEECTF